MIVGNRDWLASQAQYPPHSQLQEPLESSGSLRAGYEELLAEPQSLACSVELGCCIGRCVLVAGQDVGLQSDWEKF